MASEGMGPDNTPIVTLDKTLADFYNEENKNTGDRVVIVASYPHGLRVEDQRYVYHDEDRESDVELSDGLTEAEGENASETMRALGAQKFSFCVGDMPLVIFDPANGRADRVTAFRTSVSANLAILSSSQQPKLRFFASPSLVVLNDKTFKLAPRLPMDGMDRLPHILHPDIHYELLSKRGLAIATFLTPRSHLLDLNIDAPQSESAIFRDPIKTWKDEVLQTISNRPIPFVLKLQQTILGKGTYIIKTEKARCSLVSKLPSLMSSNASRTNKTNNHLMPATLIITDFVDCPETGSPSFAITFFVRRNGTHIFINCCEQILSEHYSWDGSSITFSQQDEFEKHFSKTVSDVSRYLQSKGYYGCVGIDVLEDKEGKQWVVDMNVRPPGSLVLGLVKGFLSTERGFDEASLLSSVRINGTKQEFLKKFSKEFAEGHLIMTACYHDTDHDVSWISLIVGGKTKEDIRSLTARLTAF
ncbi:hypothetical protein EG329_007442 [Mollisiaceae sp. DMI_Dod_QoI]|nr:hypothetical protein EG329_007442 [Helotiales sp. DMI_Dod_QoI]